nr:MAG TPA: hypothetical protein [Caudoviricetes sp.]
MERLTSPNINVNPDTDRFLHAAIGGKEIDWKQSRDRTLHVLLNGPTSNGFCKDIFRKMARDLYGRLKAYEDTGWTPEMLRKLGENAGHLRDFAQAAESMTVGRLKELAESDKTGRLAVLPCRVGEKIYYLNGKYIIEVEVVGYKVDETGAWLFIGETYNPETNRAYHCDLETERIGKTVFFTREDAKKTMEGMENGNKTSL